MRPHFEASRPRTHAPLASGILSLGFGPKARLRCQCERFGCRPLLPTWKAHELTWRYILGARAEPRRAPRRRGLLPLPRPRLRRAGRRRASRPRRGRGGAAGGGLRKWRGRGPAAGAAGGARAACLPSSLFSSPLLLPLMVDCANGVGAGQLQALLAVRARRLPPPFSNLTFPLLLSSPLFFLHLAALARGSQVKRAAELK